MIQDRAPGNIFVGRQREMETLATALENSLSGQGHLVMLAGEPGIGKTRTAQELASLATARGAQVLWGWCYEEEGAPPYWPWVQPIRSYVQQADSERLRSEMGPGAADIAELIPQTRAKLPGLEIPPELEPEQARFRLFDSITTFLKNAALNQPLMLVLDDLHWADKPSLLLLQFLARELAPIQSSRLLVVGCYRDMELSRQHPLSETLAQLSRTTGGGGGGFQRILLRGLDQEDTARIIEASAGIEPPAELVEALFAQTEGNPFFMSEVIRLLSESGNLTSGLIGTPDGVKIPEGVREVIGQRLNRLSEQCNEVLTTASIIGREFDFRLLNMLNGEISEDQLIQTVNEAVSFHLIEDVPGHMDRYQFVHALIRQTLAEELTTSPRVRLHARIAEALEALYGDDAEAHAAELAHHYNEAQTSTGPDKLVRYSLLAGERALAAYAYEDALAHFKRGLAGRDISLSGTEAAPDEEAAALLFGLARAQSTAAEVHQFSEVFATISRAFEYYAGARNVAQAVAVAEFQIAVPGNRILGVAELIARALTLVPADSYEAGRLLSRYGGILGDEKSDYEGAQQAFGRAIAIARREGDVFLEVQTLTHATGMSSMHLHFQESVDNGRRAIELDTGEENPFSYVVSHWWTAMSLLAMGDLDAARPHALASRDMAARRGTPRLAASHNFTPVTFLSCLEGDWKAGRDYSDQGMEVSPLNIRLLFARVLLEHETGESAQGEVYLKRLLEAMRRAGPGQFFASVFASMTIAVIARITGVPDRLEIAEAAAEAVLSEQSVVPVVAMQAKAALALLAGQQGDRSAAEKRYADLIGQRGTMIGPISSVDRLLGLVSQTIGNLDQAAEHFEEALAFCRQAGYRPELAWTCCDYADCLLAGAGLKPAPTHADQEKAVALLDESLAISTELGMRPLMERATERLDRAHAQADATSAYPDGLTEREVEVLRLIAGGKTNREIAEELVIAEGTARRHVANIYEKIGAANRAEATGYALRERLLSLDET